MTYYHSNDGWRWRRLADGSVQVSHKLFGGSDHIEIELPPNIWASVVASVSARGENAETYDAATDLHNRETARGGATT